jgi:phage-related minor tail protein
MPALPGTSTNGGLLSVIGATNGVRPTLTPSGIVNSPVAANQNTAATVAGAVVNGVRPSLTPSGIVNSPVSTTGMPTGLTANEQLTWNHFAAQGMQPHQIAGIMGNIKAESEFSPAAIGDGGNAFGIAQWNDRAPAMKAFVGPDYATNTQGQLNFMSHEFATTENPAYQRLMASTNVTEANNAMLSYERPSGFSLANPTGAHQYTNRLAYSQDYLQRANSTGTLSAAANDNSTASLPNLDQANQSLAKLSTTSLKASTDVSSLSTGADTAAKALSSSSNSVTSSVSSLATTTAQIPQQTQGLFSSMMSSIGGGFSSIFSGIGSLFGGLFAEGGVFKNGNVTAFAAGGVVGGPTMFPMRNGMGIMGERGPEAIMPLRRGPDGNLGVMMHAGLGAGPGSQNVQYMIRMENVIKVEGVGDKDLMTKIHDGVDKQMGDNLKRFSREELPGHVKKIQSDKWARG